MFINIFCTTFLYIIFMGFAYALSEEFIENPLWLGLIVMFWPIAMMCAIPYMIFVLFVNWIKNCIEYYREKRDGGKN